MQITESASLLIIVAIVLNGVARCYSDCALNEFTCENGQCIPKAKKCDTIIADCIDQSDEGAICKCDPEAKNLFICTEEKGNGFIYRECVFQVERCNGHWDCVGGEDELNCPEDRSAITCDEKHWLCEDRSYCIQLTERCDGTSHCPDGSDEKNCNNTCDEYKCHNGKCLNDKKLICDGVDDCGDNSDEFHCATKCSLEDDLFSCPDNSSCLRLDMVCDGKPDCVDGSDESASCKDKPCSALKCPSNKCKQLPTGPKCHCGKGYTQLEGKSTCEDINECSEKPVCSQKCTNLPGTFACDCIEDFHLDTRDNQTCLSNTNVSSWIYYSTEFGIYQYNLEHHYEIKIKDRLHAVVGIAADDTFVYWTENLPQEQRVARMRHNSTVTETVAMNGVGSAEGLAVDWWTRNLYFTDSIYAHIVVCGSDTLTCLPLITKDLQRPRGIAVNPASAQMFWGEWGDRPHIGVAFMNGEGQRAFVDHDIGWPNGIAIDYPSDRLFWVDAKTGTFESILLNGRDRKVVLFDKDRHAFNVQVLGPKLYWTEKHEFTLNSMDKHSGRHSETLVVKESLRSLYTYHPLIQKKINDSANPCHQHHCSQLCLLAANRKYTCACSNNRLPSFGGVCDDRRTKILIGYGKSVFQLDFEEVGVPKLSSFGRQQLTKNVINRMAYNQRTGDIFIADNMQRMILLLRPGYLRQTSTLVARDVGKVSSLSVDHRANNLYWTDSVRQTVEVLSLQTRQRTIVHRFHNDFYPYAVVLAPQSGKLFVAVNKDPVKIFQMAMNGAGMTNYLRKWEMARKETADVALTIDEEHSVVYAAVGKRIISWNYVQNKDMNYRSDLSLNINQLVMIPENRRFFWTGGDQYIYWDSKSPKLDKSMLIYLADKQRSAAVPTTIPIVTMPPALYKTDHPCMAKNGGCSDICVSLGNGFTCLCGLGRIFKGPDNRTCIPQIDCEFQCQNGECITLGRFCNGKKDCADGSDEENCLAKDITANHITCSYDEFKCFDGSECLEIAQKCDHHVDCKDGSDELFCENFNLTTRCHKHQYLCNNTMRCVDLVSVCDSVDDCGDYSDEILCTLPKSERPSCGDLNDCGNGQCVDPSWICDGELDCLTGDDEAACAYKSDDICPSGYFACGGLTCVAMNLVCDGHSDCSDGSDELGCDHVHATVPDTCEFQCASNTSMCIKKSQVCDGYSDCHRGEDERNCSMCLPDQFQCQTFDKYHSMDSLKWCLEREFVCDKEPDCPDGSDELNCGHNVTKLDVRHEAHIPCHSDMFHCNSGECLDMIKVCDLVPDCSDGSDEGGQCSTACLKDNCEHDCRELPTGPICTCAEGFELGSNGKSCKDINECLERPCDQMCENHRGSFQCTCYPNFMLHGNKKTCKAMGSRSYLFYTTQSQIRKLSNFPVLKEIFWTMPLNTEISGLAVDIPRQLMYASSLSLGTIYQIDIRNKTFKLVEADSPGKIAVDWSSGNLYVTSNSGIDGGRIRVCNFESRKCVAVITLRRFYEIDHVEVDAREQRLFFIQQAVYFGFESERTLYSARLDGTNKVPIYKPFPGSVFTVDVNKRTIYFVDPVKGKLMEINYEGHQEKQISSGLQDVTSPQLTGIAVFQSYVYMSVAGRPFFVSCATAKISLSCATTHLDVANAKNLLIMQDTVQPSVDNICDNHRCTRMCIPAMRGPKCLCNGGVQVGPGEQCPYYVDEDDTAGDFVALDKEEAVSIVALPGFRPSVMGRVMLSLLLILSFVAGAAYYVYRRRYLMSTFSIGNSFTNVSLETSSATKDLPPVVYKPNINMDPETHLGSEITFDEKESIRSHRSNSSRSQRSIIVSSTVSDESGEFSDATHLIK